MMIKFVKYTHPASTGYDASISHELDDVVKVEGIERVKVLFSPIDFKWEDLDPPKKEMLNKRSR